jgi:bifunctional non-homologous end joining protein LigD
MLLRRTEKLPDGETWCYELKFDGYRALAIKTARKVHLRSRNDNDFTARYPQIVKALSPMPDETVIPRWTPKTGHRWTPEKRPTG